MKKRNPRFGYLRIAMQIQHAFGIELDKGVVKRVLDKHYRPAAPGNDGPSWLTFIGQTKDSLWSLDFFRCESNKYPRGKPHGIYLFYISPTRETRVNGDSRGANASSP